jgi:Fic/DOC family
VPPPAELLPSLIDGQAKLADGRLADGLHPLLRAALVSFGFVFAHPFLDGNGRLSRFLAHYTLCQSGALSSGYILPLSTAMKRNESAYLAALQSFSVPARELWQVNWLDADSFTFDFRGHSSIYRYFDATRLCEFTYAMAQESLRHDLRAEIEFLHCYDRVLREVNALYDIDGTTLSKLIRMTLSNGGTLSKLRRKQFAPALPVEVFTYIEERVREAQTALAPRRWPPATALHMSRVKSPTVNTAALFES